MDSSSAAGKICANFDIRLALPEHVGDDIVVYLDIGDEQLGKADLRQCVLEMARDADGPEQLKCTVAALRQIADQVEAQLTRSPT